MRFRSAVDHGRLDAVKLLLAASADIETTGPGSRSCLQRACFHGHEPVVQLLLAREIRRQLDVVDEQGATAFFAACHEGHESIARVLASRGASIEQPASDGSTPLFVAAQNGHYPVVKFLVESGADKDKPREGGFTPLYIASQHGHVDVVQFLLTGRLHKEESDDGKKQSRRARQAKMAEQEAIAREAASFVGADADAASEDGVSPACVAAHEGHSEVLDFLGKHDKKLLRAETRTGLTPLHCAAAQGHVDAAKTLAKYGVNLSQLDSNGLTPLRMAEKAGKTATATFICTSSLARHLNRTASSHLTRMADCTDTKLNPAVDNEQIAKQWKTKNERNVMPCFRKKLQDKHVKEVKAKHKDSVNGASLSLPILCAVWAAFSAVLTCTCKCVSSWTHSVLPTLSLENRPEQSGEGAHGEDYPAGEDRTRQACRLS